MTLSESLPVTEAHAVDRAVDRTVDLAALPADFAWGTATSAYQIEGAVDEDGRAPSIWDTFSRVPGAVDGGHTGDTACDHYHRWPDDIALMRQLGTNAYRLSVAWPRILPGGDGPVNTKGLDFYDRLTDGLLAAGIEPNVTLYHWDLPQALQDRGGWPERATAEHFAAYAGLVAERLGDRVTQWATLNEPLCSAWIGHLEGRMAPAGPTSPPPSAPPTTCCSATASPPRPSAPPAPPRASASSTTSPPSSPPPAARPTGPPPGAWTATSTAGGSTPSTARLPRRHARGLRRRPPRTPRRPRHHRRPLDWIGLNYYFPQVVTADPAGPAPFARQIDRPGVPRTGMDWEVDAGGLETLIMRLHEEYGDRRIHITENGSSYPDTVAPDGRVHDPERAAYLTSHLAACGRAARRGAPVAGYYAWSLLDNFEWAYGYDKRFGLVHVDYATQRRTVKTSGRRYAEIIAAHRSAR